MKSKPILGIGLGEQKLRQVVSGNEFRPDKLYTCTRKELIEPCVINKLNGCPEILTAQAQRTRAVNNFKNNDENLGRW